jgi:hypothetical protein
MPDVVGAKSENKKDVLTNVPPIAGLLVEIMILELHHHDKT